MECPLPQEELAIVNNALVKAREFFHYLQTHLGPELTKMKEEIVRAEQIIEAKRQKDITATAAAATDPATEIMEITTPALSDSRDMIK